jgi:hypothetical protein
LTQRAPLHTVELDVRTGLAHARHLSIGAAEDSAVLLSGASRMVPDCARCLSTAHGRGRSPY